MHQHHKKSKNLDETERHKVTEDANLMRTDYYQPIDQSIRFTLHLLYLSMRHGKSKNSGNN